MLKTNQLAAFDRTFLKTGVTITIHFEKHSRLQLV